MKIQNNNNNISLIPILLVNFIGTLGFSVVLPFLVFLVTRFGGNAFLFGITASIYPFFQLIGAPLLGKWSDIYGRKKILLLSQIGTTISWLLFIFAIFLPIIPLYTINISTLGSFFISIPLIILIIARALDGITGGNVSVANAYIADITKEKDRKKNYGKMSISSNLGFIIGPALAGILGATIYKELIPVIAAFTISLIAVVIIRIYLPESKSGKIKQGFDQLNIRKIFGHEQKSCYSIKKDNKIKLVDVLKIKNIPYLLLLYFLIFLGFNLFYTSFPIHASQKLLWSITELGVYFAFLSFIMVIVQGPVLSYISKKINDSVLIIIGNIFLGLNFILLLSLDFKIVYIAAIFFAVGNGFMWPSFLSYLSRIAGTKLQGSVQGFASSFGSIASIIGLILGGLIYSIMGVYVFLISSFVIFFIVILPIKLVKIEKILT
jgi:DHA1 family tetracycline resistance protein-like MFS transporter